MVKSMQSSCVCPNLVVYSTIIDGLCKAGRIGESRNVFSSLVVHHVKLDVCTSNIMINGLCRAGKLNDSVELIKKMEESGCSPNDITYNTIIKGFLHTNEASRALEFLSIMTGKGFAADDYTCSLFLELLTSPNVSDDVKAELQEYFGIKT